jgi:hypothetical protein
MDSPAIGLDGTEGVLYPLLMALGGSRLRFALALTNAAHLSVLSLFLSSTLRIDGSGEAVGALVDVWHIVGRLVVAYDVLPRIALLAQHRVSVVFGVATDTLDRGRFFFFNRAVQGRRAVCEDGPLRFTVEGDGSRLQISMRLDRRDVCHNPPVVVR